MAKKTLSDIIRELERQIMPKLEYIDSLKTSGVLSIRRYNECANSLYNEILDTVRIKRDNGVIYATKTSLGTTEVTNEFPAILHTVKYRMDIPELIRTQDINDVTTSSNIYDRIRDSLKNNPIPTQTYEILINTNRLTIDEFIDYGLQDIGGKAENTYISYNTDTPEKTQAFYHSFMTRYEAVKNDFYKSRDTLHNIRRNLNKQKTSPARIPVNVGGNPDEIGRLDVRAILGEHPWQLRGLERIRKALEALMLEKMRAPQKEQTSAKPIQRDAIACIFRQMRFHGIIPYRITDTELSGIISLLTTHSKEKTRQALSSDKTTPKGLTRASRERLINFLTAVLEELKHNIA